MCPPNKQDMLLAREILRLGSCNVGIQQLQEKYPHLLINCYGLPLESEKTLKTSIKDLLEFAHNLHFKGNKKLQFMVFTISTTTLSPMETKNYYFARKELILSCTDYCLPYRNIGLDVKKIGDLEPKNEKMCVFFVFENS